MKNKMTIWGIGGTLAWTSVIFSVVIIFINRHLLPGWRFSHLPAVVVWGIGGLFILDGMVILFFSIRSITRAFRNDKLTMAGAYSVVRHPLYSAWIVFIVPGIVLISRYILCWLIPIFMYVVFKALIKKEDDYLEQKFGDEYRNYRKRVNELFPRF